MQSVHRAVRILGCFTLEHPELGVTELSRELGLHKSTVSRLLLALRDEGLVVQSGTGRYRLGARVLGMAAVVLSSLDVVAVAEPSMQGLVAEIGETVSLVVQQGGVCFDLHTLTSPHPVRAERAAGQVVPTWLSAASRIWLAFDASHHQGDGQAQGMSGDVQKLADIRGLGYALVRGAWAPDLVDVAAPVLDFRGRIRAALCICGPSHRLTPEVDGVVTAALLRAAKQISAQLGYAP